MIIVTGSNGFIGSNTVRLLTRRGYAVLAVDHGCQDRYEMATHCLRLDAQALYGWIESHGKNVTGVIHLGGVSETIGRTTEDYAESGLFSRALAVTVARYAPQAPFVYASSAATYGRNHSGAQLFLEMQPLSEYAKAKHAFDLWMTEDSKAPERWFGLKYFNVYGPNEQHKGKSASMITQAAQQLHARGVVQLFQADRPITRDFVYVDDVVDATTWFMDLAVRGRAPFNGLYNIGSGVSESFETVVHEVADVLGVPPSIAYIPLPPELKDQYQYETKADLSRLRHTGYMVSPTTLHEGVQKMRAYLESLA